MSSPSLPCTVHPGIATPRYLVEFDPASVSTRDTHALVIGGGIAGLSAALALAEAGRDVTLLVKKGLRDSNTAFAQGGVAAVLDETEREKDDDLELHIADTLRAGAGLCDADAVRSILADSSASIDFLRRHGCVFDLEASGHVSLTREGGHSARRILHANGDATGAEVARSLAVATRANAKITIIDNAFALDLLTEDGRVSGVAYHRGDATAIVRANATILATGGCGAVWRETTNPPGATGDGLAIAYRAGAVLADMEFMQFHPTTLYIAGGARLLISEAMRGEGAILRNRAGERFMPRYHPDAEMAPRDVVTRAIMEEIRISGFPHVWLDATAMGREFLSARFPAISRACASFGIDVVTEWIPVHPSAHYHCGGVVSDAHGATTLPGLWAAGEVGCTGLHGANRLASNSLLEGLVVGIRAGTAAAALADIGTGKHTNVSAIPREAAPQGLDVPDLVTTARSLMWRQVGITRNAQDLATARRSLNFWLEHQARGEFSDRQGWQLQNLLSAGALIAMGAERRKASVGTHSRSDSQGEIDPTHHGFQRPPG